MRYQVVSSPKNVVWFLTLLTITVFFHCSATAKTQNSLKRGSSLSVEDDSDFLTSPDESFTCGFHGVGTNAYWFSIWFTNSKSRTVVWMANRDKPVNSLGSRVSLRKDGSLVLTDVDGATLWQTSTNSSSLDVERAELLNSGNLVLKDAHGKIRWQSFDFPTDIVLPNQPFTKSKKLISTLGIGTFGLKKGSALRAMLLAALKLKLLQPFEAFPRTDGGHELPSHPAIAGVNFSSSSGGFWSCRGQLTTLAPLWIRPCT